MAHHIYTGLQLYLFPEQILLGTKHLVNIFQLTGIIMGFREPLEAGKDNELDSILGLLERIPTQLAVTLRLAALQTHFRFLTSESLRKQIHVVLSH